MNVHHLFRALVRSTPLRFMRVVLAMILAFTSLLAIPIAVVQSATIPSSFFTVVDQQGANDQPAQSDLSQMGRDDTSDASHLKLFWSWDSTDQWSGTGQTGDACALFDTDGDGNINFVVCGEIHNTSPTTVVQGSNPSPTVWTCTDNKNDRCTNPTSTTFTSTDVQAGILGNPSNATGNLITDTDPFPSGSNYPNDSTLQVNILKSFLPTGAILVNVCSYPSIANGGNNNPFDCIITPGGGFLVIKKDAGTDTTTNFVFTVAPVPANQSSSYTVTGTNQTAPIGLTVGAGESVTEAVPTAWQLDTASCTLQSGASTGTKSGNAVNSISIESGKVTTCTFHDVQKPALTVQKDNDANRDQTFNDTETVPANALYPYTVTYKATITNSSSSTATISSITDNKTASLTLSANTTAPSGAVTCVSLVSTSIGAGATLTCYYDVTFADPNTAQVVNTITVVATNSAGSDTKTDTSTVNFTQVPALSLTKTASPTTYSAVGQTITYNYEVKNSGNVTLSGPFTITDDKATVTCPNTASLAPGVSIVCTASYSISQTDLNTGSVTNTAQAHASFGGNPVDSNQDSETVTAVQSPALSLIKTANPTTYSVVGQTITYSYVVQNTGNVTLSGPFTINDDKQGSFQCGSATSLAPGATVSCTSTHTITQADLDAGSITNTATATNGTVTSNPATATVTASRTSQITPTGTTCAQFRDGSAATLDTLLYTVKSGKVNSVAPGVFFYWVKVTAVAGSNTFKINQAITSSSNNFNHFFSQISGSFAYTSGCSKISANISTSGGVTTVTFNASSAGTYIIGIKYDSTSVKDFNAPNPNTTVSYTFTLMGSPSSTQGLNLVKKP